MSRLSPLVLALVALCAGQASSLEIKNVRLAYGDFGVTRPDKKFLPGDVLLLMYDIDGLALDEKSNKVSFESVLEVLDSKKKSIYSKNYPPLEVPMQLGGKRVPGELRMNMGVEQEPGIYTVKVTLTDRVAIPKKTVELTYPIELLPKDFGIIHLKAPAFGIPALNYPINFNLVNAPVDKKTKAPTIDITLRMFEEGNKTELGKAMTINFPAQLPEEFDAKILPVSFNIFPTRPGRFLAELEVHEKLTNRKIKMQLPIPVLELK